MPVFTSGQVATMLGLSTSTLRRYVLRYGFALSDGARVSRSRRFTGEDVKILQGVRGQLSAGKTPDDVKGLLSVWWTYPWWEAEGPAAATVLDLLPGMGQELAGRRHLAQSLRLEIQDVAARLAAACVRHAAPFRHIWK